MAAVTTPEHVEQHSAPVAEKAVNAPTQKIEIDGNLLAMLGVGVALFALALGAFTYLGGRIDTVEAKLERSVAELRTDIKDVNVKIDRVSMELNTKIDRVSTDLNTKIDKLSTELNGKIDKVSMELNGKIDKLSAEQRAENREINARLDRLFELIAAQGRRDTQ